MSRHMFLLSEKTRLLHMSSLLNGKHAVLLSTNTRRPATKKTSSHPEKLNTRCLASDAPSRTCLLVAKDAPDLMKLVILDECVLTISPLP